MSTTTLTAPTPVDVRAVHTRPGLTRLIAVELRKTIDTRAGVGLHLAVAVLTVVVVAVRSLTGGEADHTFAAILDQAIMPSAVLLPVIGVLLVTTEWSQRTGLITFTLVPNRIRVLVAKVVAALGLTVASLGVTFTAVAAGVLVAGPQHGAWSDVGALIGQSTVFLTVGVLTAVGFGMLLRFSAPALVVLFALPSAWMGVLSLAPFADVAPWLDTARALAPMHREPMTGAQWAHAGTAILLWTVIPLAAGLWRSVRRDPVA